MRNYRIFANLLPYLAGYLETGIATSILNAYSGNFSRRLYEKSNFVPAGASGVRLHVVKYK
ncbi:hypothetical protein [Dyadobacter sp. 3J3]|uniref:hypothetical protein n=1 Tax=Dyadobacter sp. 3J3 TaxID=2606600 RepID=UPI00135C317B|nr:hypothetical protein [Dyadobacter sp. 3J3]